MAIEQPTTNGDANRLSMAESAKHLSMLGMLSQAMRRTLGGRLPLACIVVGLCVGFSEARGQSPTPSRPRSLHVGEHEQYNQRSSLIQRGRQVYNHYCVGCHGPQGKGQGPAAQRLITKPRDFTKGIYKFRSTDSGSLPLEIDLYRTITRGLSRVSMPGFPLMAEHDKLAVIQYIKSFYRRWDQEKHHRKKIFVPPAPADLDTPQRVARGNIVYIAMQCGKCHGSDGAGTGATQTQYVDAWGNPQKAFDFTLGKLKGGDDPEDIYRTFHTGLRSVMPSYGGVTLAAVNQETFISQVGFVKKDQTQTLMPILKTFPRTAADVFTQMNEHQQRQAAEKNSWDLVAYVRSLRRGAPAVSIEADTGSRSGTP